MAAPQMQVDPFAQMFGAAAGVATKALADNTPQTSNTNFSSGYDGSGWVVNTGSGSASNAQSRSELGNLMGMLKNPLVLGAICVGIYLWTKR